MNDRSYLSTRVAIWACLISWALYSPLIPQTVQETWAMASAGIGVMTAREEGDIVVKQVVRGGPAAQAGVRSGDIISKVNGKDTTSMTMDQVASLILGQAGTMVRLEITRKGNPMRELVIRRAPLNGRTSQWSNQPVVKHNEASCEIHDHRIVGAEDEGGLVFFVHLFHQLQYLFPGLGIKVGRRFVGQDDLRILDQRLAMATRCCCPPDSWRG